LDPPYCPRPQIITPTRLDPLPTAPETEPGLSQDSTFFQMLQRRRCDLFIDSPKARRLACRQGEIRHLLEISPDSPTGIVRDTPAHTSTEAVASDSRAWASQNSKSLSAMAEPADDGSAVLNSQW
jgi:hypothetical protein